MVESLGELFDGTHSTPTSVLVRLDRENHTLQLTVEGNTFTFDSSDLSKPEKVGANYQCALKAPDGKDLPNWVLSYQDANLHSALESIHFHTLKPLGQTWHWIGQFQWWKLALGAAVLLFLFFKLCLFGLQYAYKITPVTYDHHLGGKVDSTYSKWVSRCQSPALDSFFVKGLNQLALPSDQFPHRIWVLNDTTENAIAIPGGTIYVFRGLLESSQSPDEILGVIGHEISHSELRHTVRQIIQSTGMTYLITLTVGMAIEGMDLLEGLEATLEMSSALLTLRYSRNFESEADSLGIVRMHRAGLKVGPLDTLLTRLRPKPRMWDRVLGFLSTHPLTEERSQRFTAAKVHETFTSDTLFSQERLQWETLKRSCSVEVDSTPLWKKILRR